MKLLITALSSILAVCSVTVANPVLTSSITSIESTSTTASPSTTAASEPDYSNPFDPYSLYMTNCYPINFDGILLIEMLASTTHRAEQIEKSINKKKAETKNQKKVVGRLKEKIVSLRAGPSGWPFRLALQAMD
ncbi:hypothetical protein QVD99_003245 [Batrachochytrium dendrobatidis]|nr:hypothetical protein QVD99_003245 [Batrachochytrium dendrobatidis]